MAVAGLVSIALAVGGLVVGLRAAWLWYLSAQVPIVPTYAEWGATEPEDSAMDWVIGHMNAYAKAATLNAQAARWTAGAVVLSGVAGVAGAWPH